MNLEETVTSILNSLREVLLQLTDEQYTSPSKALSNATIGQHVRHSLDTFLCLELGYSNGLVNYDNRLRDPATEQHKLVALEVIVRILKGIQLKDKSLVVEAFLGNKDVFIHAESSYTRELMYNLEHTIHHMALIRIALLELTNLPVPDDFGVAPSTLQFKSECAQ